SGFTALGDRLLERSDMDRAKEAYTKALEKDPESIPARIGLAWCYGLVGDHMRALEAFTILSEQPGLDVELLSRVLVGRGFTKHQSGDLVRALSDYTAVLGLDGAPPDSLSWVLRYRGAAYEKLGRIDEALADYGHCVELSGKTMYSSFSALVNLLCREGRTAESIDWLTRLEDLEPDGTPMEARLDARVELITQVAKTCSMDEAVKLLDVLLETSSRPIRERLAFLKPGLEYALDGDESRLSALPTEEREIAERIAATIKKAVESPEKGQDGKQPI
ncbi:MAG: tetratricopeptide repeat protein, partial [Proteobacteria bacterium]|nr:tetratricopeptide repeat protein [Pseudomonadota bacterium]